MNRRCRRAPSGEPGDDEAVADVELTQGQQRRVAPLPGAIGKVARQASDPAGDDPLVEQGEGGHVGPYRLVEIGIGVAASTRRPFLDPNVEWVTPKRTLHGIDELREQLTWGSPQEKLDLEFGELGMKDLGDGRIVSDVNETYRVKGTGDFAYARDRRVELMIRGGSIARYEMRIVG